MTTATTPQWQARDEAFAWLTRQLRWERTLTRLRDGAPAEPALEPAAVRRAA